MLKYIYGQPQEDVPDGVRGRHLHVDRCMRRLQQDRNAGGAGAAWVHGPLTGLHVIERLRRRCRELQSGGLQGLEDLALGAGVDEGQRQADDRRGPHAHQGERRGAGPHPLLRRAAAAEVAHHQSTTLYKS